MSDMDGNRYFASDADNYERVRLSLDRALGYPDARALTSFSPLQFATRASDGRVLLAARRESCAITAVARVLPSLLASGAVVEITRAEYEAAMPRGTP